MATVTEFETRAKAMYETARSLTQGWYGAEVEAAMSRPPVYTDASGAPERVLMPELQQPWSFSIAVSRPGACEADGRVSSERVWAERDIVTAESVQSLISDVNLWVNSLRE